MRDVRCDICGWTEEGLKMYFPWVRDKKIYRFKQTVFGRSGTKSFNICGHCLAEIKRKRVESMKREKVSDRLNP